MTIESVVTWCKKVIEQCESRINTKQPTEFGLPNAYFKARAEAARDLVTLIEGNYEVSDNPSTGPFEPAESVVMCPDCGHQTHGPVCGGLRDTPTNGRGTMANEKIDKFISTVEYVAKNKPRTKIVRVGIEEAKAAADSLRKSQDARAKGGKAAAASRELIDTPAAAANRERVRKHRQKSTG